MRPVEAKGLVLSMKISFNKKYTTIALYAAILILFSVVCITVIIVRPVGLFSLWESIKQILKTLFYALIVAYIMAPLMNFFNKKALKFIQPKREVSVIRKLISLFLTFAVFLAVITVFVWFVAPQVMKNIENLGSVLKGYYDSIDTYIQTLRQNSDVFDKLYSTLLQSDGNLDDLLTKAVSSLLAVITNASSYIITFVSTFVNEVKTIFVGIFLSLYFVYYKEMLIAQIGRFGKAFLRPNTCKYAAHIIDDIDIKFAKFLRGKAFDSTLVGIVLYIIYKIVGIPYAEILAIVGGVMNMVPVFGPLISGFICGFILLLTAPHKLIAYIIIVVAVGLIDSNLIEPKLLGDSLGLKPVWITLAIIIMSALFGFFGMFFGVPIFAVIYTLVKEAIDNRVAQREAREAYEQAHVATHQEQENDPDEGSDLTEDSEKDENGSENATEDTQK